jgi:spore coat polysaccharide biosynthesis protein SpsF
VSIIAVIQARISSTRLPGKVLKKIEGKTVLEHVINRVKVVKNLDDVIVATTVKKEDLEIVKLCANLGISVFCGSEDDVLDRYYQAARLFKAKHIIRITSDCPLIDFKVIEGVVDLYFRENANYATNTIPETFPDGEDVEVFSFKALKIAWENAELSSEREHITPYIRNNPSIFKIVNLKSNINLSNKRWTIDESEDFKFIKIIYKNLYPKDSLFGMETILNYLRNNPEVEKINKNIIRNEGYLKSLKEDKILNLGLRRNK